MKGSFISTCSAFLYGWTLSLFNFRVFYLKKMRRQPDLGAAVEKCFADNDLN